MRASGKLGSGEGAAIVRASGFAVPEAGSASRPHASGLSVRLLTFTALGQSLRQRDARPLPNNRRMPTLSHPYKPTRSAPDTAWALAFGAGSSDEAGGGATLSNLRALAAALDNTKAIAHRTWMRRA